MSWFDDDASTGGHEARPGSRTPGETGESGGRGDGAHTTERGGRAASWGVAPGPGLWPWGRRARARRARRAEATDAVHERARQLRERGKPATDDDPPSTAGPWRPVPTRQNLLAISCLIAVVALVAGLAWWMSTVGTFRLAGVDGKVPVDTGDLTTAAADTSLYTSIPSSSLASPAAGESSGPVAPQPPIPTGGVPPMSPPSPAPVDPASVPVVDLPSHPAGPDNLSTPESAMAAFLSRWCPYTYTDEFGARARRARPAMTQLAYSAIDPASRDSARRSWQQVVAQQQTARCTRPRVQISPEAPRQPDRMYVIGRIRQVTTTGDGQVWVDTLAQTRLVVRGDDGLWRVGRIVEGG